MDYVTLPWPSKADLKAAVAEEKSMLGKLKLYQQYYADCRARGEWKTDNPHAR